LTRKKNDADAVLFILDYRIKKGVMPTYKEVAVAMESSEPTVGRLMQAMMGEGLLDGSPGRKPTDITAKGEALHEQLSIEADENRDEDHASDAGEHRGDPGDPEGGRDRGGDEGPMEEPASPAPPQPGGNATPGRRRPSDARRRGLEPGDSGARPEGPARVPAANPPAPVDGGDPKPRRLIRVLSEQHMMHEAKFYNLVRNQLISVGRGEEPPSEEEVALVMHTMHKYGLDPIIRQVYAFRSKGKLNIVVGYDGRVKIAESQPDFRGVTYEEGPFVDLGEITRANVMKGRRGPEYIRAICWREGRKPVAKTVWMHEWFLPQENWIRYANHRLQQKAYSLAVREAYGLSVMDEEDAGQIKYHDAKAEVLDGAGNASMLALESMAKAMSATQRDVEEYVSKRTQPSDAPGSPESDDRSGGTHHTDGPGSPLDGDIRPTVGGVDWEPPLWGDDDPGPTHER